MTSWHIYTLADPRLPDIIRYVGVAHRGLPARLAAHVHLARKGVRRHVYSWVRRLLRDGVTPSIVSIQMGEGEGWTEAERAWIQRCREDGHPLTNATEGGEGTLGYRHSAEARAKMSASRTGLTISASTIRAMADGRRGKRQSLERVSHRIEAIKRTWAKKKADGWEPPPDNPEGRARTTAANRGRPCSDATKARISFANKGRQHSPEARARMSAGRKAAKMRREEDNRES